MAYFYEDWRHKKLTVEDTDGQFFLNFGEAESNMISNIDKMIEEDKQLNILSTSKNVYKKVSCN